MRRIFLLSPLFCFFLIMICINCNTEILFENSIFCTDFGLRLGKDSNSIENAEEASPKLNYAIKEKVGDLLNGGFAFSIRDIQRMTGISDIESKKLITELISMMELESGMNGEIEYYWLEEYKMRANKNMIGPFHSFSIKNKIFSLHLFLNV